MFTNDTNILVYSIDATDLPKHLTAKRIVQAHTIRRYPVMLQSLSELYFATTRKSLLSNADASQIVTRTLSISPVIPYDSSDVAAAMRLHDLHKIQFFDALLLATAARSGCTTLFSEDFQHNRAYGTITVRNPFLLSPAELDALLD
ncbi:PIN domain-containing protein [Granulicella sp. 5B5]|uniref:PIN domain-containing protein n=1 Tax=Granulicella sp. 5B5 TaxID=1617967 RepID=UPI0015F726AD|nr:PIN domain-containing protein [Granulicella sp. 5B5]QMV18238.1 PIN domain-containing protein [Granulicella sp. 5B5]